MTRYILYHQIVSRQENQLISKNNHKNYQRPKDFSFQLSENVPDQLVFYFSFFVLYLMTRFREFWTIFLLQEPGYHPQVEAISPTPDDRTQERDDVKSTKDDLLQKISKVDREIAKAESQIAKLKKKQVQYSSADIK